MIQSGLFVPKIAKGRAAQRMRRARVTPKTRGPKRVKGPSQFPKSKGTVSPFSWAFAGRGPACVPLAPGFYGLDPPQRGSAHSSSDTLR